jgi:hypothetical protein
MIKKGKKPSAIEIKVSLAKGEFFNFTHKKNDWPHQKCQFRQWLLTYQFGKLIGLTDNRIPPKVFGDR